MRAGSKTCALSLANVLEAHRALPVEELADAPAMVEGLTVVRGRPCPVVNLATLLGVSGGGGRYFINLRLDERRLALRVDELVGLRAIDAAALEAIPPVVEGSLGAVVDRLGSLRRELVYVLSVARIVPEGFWREIPR